MNKYNPNLYHSRSIRLPEYDYLQEGLYSVTLCTQDRADYIVNNPINFIYNENNKISPKN